MIKNVNVEYKFFEKFGETSDIRDISLKYRYKVQCSKGIRLKMWMQSADFFEMENLAKRYLLMIFGIDIRV